MSNGRGNSGLVKIGALWPPKQGGKTVMNGWIKWGPFKMKVLILNNTYKKNDNDPAWTMFTEETDLRKPYQPQGAPAQQPGYQPAPQPAPAPAPVPTQDPVDQAAGVSPGGEYPESWE